MKKIPASLICFFTLLFFLLFSQTFQANIGEPNIQETTAPAKEISVKEFFPLDTGLRLVYKIEKCSTNNPLYSVHVFWTIGQNRGRLVLIRREIEFKPGQDEYLLILKVKGPNLEEKKSSDYDKVIEVEIERDDIGLYANAQKLFWCVKSNSRYKIYEVLYHDPSSTGSEAARGEGYKEQPAGISQQFKIFSGIPLITYAYIDEEVLYFIGPEMFENQNCLHYRRIVWEVKKDYWGNPIEQNYIMTPFTEDLWFAEGKGLVKLVQKVDGKITMTLSLKE